ncbi:MAG: interleukin-like EMT inducer domain-containing protein [Caldilineaceae bacterium]
MQRLSGRRNVLFALGLYGLFALLLTWPLIAQFTTHVPGDGIDDPALAWNLWWIKARLIEQLNPDIFHCDWMFFPIQINLAFYTLTPLNGLLSIPLQTVSGLILANNLLLLSSFVLSGLGTYLLAHQELRQIYRSHFVTSDLGSVSPSRVRPGVSVTLSPCHPIILSSIFAGFIYAFASSKLFYASLGQFNIASSQWIPFCVLYLLRLGRATTRRAQWRYAALAALFFLFQAWAELTYASFLAIFIALWFVWQMVRRWMGRRSQPSSRSSLISFLAALLLFGAIVLIGLSPILAAMLPDLRTEGDFFTSGGGFEDLFSADLAGYLLPTRLHPLLGEWIRTLPFQNGKGQQIYIGYAVLLLVGYGLWRLWRRRWEPQASLSGFPLFWSLNSFIFFLLTLGPHLRWMGQDLPIPGPFALVSHLPFFSGNRYPSRYAVMLMLCVAILAAIGMVELLNRSVRSDVAPTEKRNGWVASFSSLLLAGFIALLFLAEHLSIPLPLSDFRVPAIYERIANTPGDFTLLELPTGWRNGAREIGKRDILFMMQEWYQTVHGKRRLGGNTSRNPPYKFQYFSEAPLIGDLIALMNADQWFMSGEVDRQLPQMIERAKASAAETLSLLGVRFITVQVEKSTPQLLRFVDEALPLTLVDEWKGNDWSGAPSTIRLYEVQATQHFREGDLRSDLGKLYEAEGWSALHGTGNAIRPQATLLLNLPEAGGKLEIELPNSAPPLGLTLNGKVLTQSVISPTAETPVVQVSIPPGLAYPLVDRLEIHFAKPTVSSRAEESSGQGESNSSPFSVPIAAHSAGLDVGDFAQIFVAGQQVALNERGYNLVAISPEGSVLASVAFDTFGNCGTDPADEAASQAMAAWLAQWPAGTILAGAVADEASCRLGQSAVDALHQIGAATDLRGHFRWSHAFIGLANARPGNAVESAQLLEPAEVHVEGRSKDGKVVTDGTVYGSVGKIRYFGESTSAP